MYVQYHFPLQDGGAFYTNDTIVQARPHYKVCILEFVIGPELLKNLFYEHQKEHLKLVSLYKKAHLQSRSFFKNKVRT